jgi:hypothetical protein
MAAPGHLDTRAVLARLSSAVRFHPQSGTVTVNNYSDARCEFPDIHLPKRPSAGAQLGMGSDSRQSRSSDRPSCSRVLASVPCRQREERRTHTSVRISPHSHGALLCGARRLACVFAYRSRSSGYSRQLPRPNLTRGDLERDDDGHR